MRYSAPHRPLPNPRCATEQAYEVLPPPKFLAGYSTANAIVIPVH